MWKVALASELEGFDFEGWDLTGLDLSHIKSFSGCNFRYAKLQSTKISGKWDSCNLESATFENTNIEDATFTNTEFRFVNFDRTKIHNVTIGKGSSLYFSRWKVIQAADLTIGPGLKELGGWDVKSSDFYGVKINGGVDEYDTKTQADYSADIEYSNLSNFEISNMNMERFRFRDNELRIGEFRNVKFGEHTFFDNKTNRISLTNVSTQISINNISGVELAAFGKNS